MPTSLLNGVSQVKGLVQPTLPDHPLSEYLSRYPSDREKQTVIRGIHNQMIYTTLVTISADYPRGQNILSEIPQQTSLRSTDMQSAHFHCWETCQQVTTKPHLGIPHRFLNDLFRYISTATFLQVSGVLLCKFAIVFGTCKVGM